MKTLEYILIGILFILAVNITVEYTTYTLMKYIDKYIDSKIELMLLSLYLKNPYLDKLRVKLDSINNVRLDSINKSLNL